MSFAHAAAMSCLSRLSFDPIGVAEFGVAEFGVAEFGVAEFELAEFGVAELGLTEVAVAETADVDVDSAVSVLAHDTKATRAAAAAVDDAPNFTVAF
jgi:hypothetical protein